MSKAINTRFGLRKIEDLTTPTSTQNYPLGTVITVEDNVNAKQVYKYMYVKSHGALTQYQPYTITATGTSASEWITAAPATLASAVTIVGIPQVAFTSGYYGFVQIEGKATSTTQTTGGVIYANSPVRLATSGTGIIADSTGLVVEITTCGFAVTGTTGTDNITVHLMNRPCEIATT